ncbi:MAG: hypothetical protein HUJ56_09645, partial [Erysipelotrichaceae bacterium]|nr:hypothetical protein [Erysipelotrichaceae bacterium]
VNWKWSVTSNTNIWSYTIEEKTPKPADENCILQEFAPNGSKWVYRVKEKLASPYDKYYKVENGERNVITPDSANPDLYSFNDIKNNIVTTSTTVTKNWDNLLAYALHPSVTFELQYHFDGEMDWKHAKDNALLLANKGENDPTKLTITHAAEKTATNTFKETMSGLPQYMMDGSNGIKKVYYRLVEIKIDGIDIFTTATDADSLKDPVVYPATAVANYKIQDLGNQTFSNTMDGVVSLQVTKNWESDEDFEDWRSTVTFTIERKFTTETTWSTLLDGNGKPCEIKVDKTNEVSAGADQWTKTIDNLPKYIKDTNGTFKEVEYRAVEINAPVDYVHKKADDKHSVDSSANPTLYKSEATNALDTTDYFAMKKWFDKNN